MHVGGKACFCVANTDAIREAAERFGRNPSFIFYPEADNPAHAGVHGLESPEEALLELLADECWSEFLNKERADDLPITNCEIAADL